MNNNILEVALSYAAKGFSVFPCKPRSKEPATQQGFKDATTNEEQIKRWWTENPDYNIGMPTGKVNDFWALDIDSENAWGEAMRRGYIPTMTLYDGEGVRGTKPDACIVKTGEGFHLYFAYPEDAEKLKGSVGELADGLDIRADGNFVVAPGSIHPNGKVYEHASGRREPTLAPERLLGDVREGSKRRGAEPVNGPIPQGERHKTLVSLAGSLWNRGINTETIRRTLHVINIEQCDPPMQGRELDDIDRIAEDAARWERHEVSPSPSLKSNDSDDTLPEVKMFREMKPKKGPRPYIVDGVIYTGKAAGIYGDGGTAKSTLVMHLGQRVARGEKWLGFETVKTRVLYLDFELDEEEQTRRAYEVAAGDGYSETPEGFYYLPAAGYPTQVMFEHALKKCLEHDIGLVIVDSLGYALEGDAESSRDVLAFFRRVEGAFRREGITLLIVDHQPKTRPGSSYQDMTMFGSVYKGNSIRSVFQVEPSDREEGFINLIIRHKKVNFGPQLEPFGCLVSFEEEKTTVKARGLEPTELVKERSPNALEQVEQALEDGPKYPDDIAEETGLEIGTVKNKLTELRKARKAENTGNKRGQSNEVRKVSSPSLPIGDSDGDTLESSQDGQGGHVDNVVALPL